MVAVSPSCSVPVRVDFSCVSTIPAVLHAARAWPMIWISSSWVCVHLHVPQRGGEYDLKF